MVNNMSNFQVSAHIDANKTFLRKRSELEERWDPYFYNQKFNIFLNHLSKNNKLIRFSYYIESITNGLDQREFFESGIPYYKVANVLHGKLSKENMQFIRLSNNLTKNIKLEKNNILLTRKGSYGRAYRVLENNDAIISSEIFNIKLKDSKYAEFIEIYLNLYFGQIQFERHKIGAIMGSLSQMAVKNIFVPKIENIPIKKICTLYQECNVKKQQKEQEAQNLLDSIDDYLMEELGIELPEVDNSLESRVFQTTFSEITGKKFDAFGTKNYLNKMKSRKYEEINLSTVAYLEKGISITSNSITSGKYPVIAGGQSSPYTHNEYNHIGNVITISASGAYAGFVWYHSTPIFASDCTKVFSKDEKQITTPYIYEILKLKQQDIYNLQVGAGQPHVYSSDLSKILIPLVDFKKQNKIVAHIQSIREQAKQLQNDAQQQFEEAKKEIEQMILGEH